MRDMEKHFGENLSLDKKTQDEILFYLTTNSADKINTRISNKIMRGLGSSVPARIAEVPYMEKEHRKIKPDVFKRKSIGSFSNCVACHSIADRGDFNENNIVIPK